MSGAVEAPRIPGKKFLLFKQIWKFRSLYSLAAIAIVSFLFMKYVPLWFGQVALKEFDPNLVNVNLLVAYPWGEDFGSHLLNILTTVLFIIPNALIGFFAVSRGVVESTFTGLANMQEFLSSIYFGQLMRNTLFYSFVKLIFSLPMAIILALALYESVAVRFRRFVQTVSYLPHFLSWIIMLGVIQGLVASDGGLINAIISAGGQSPINFLGSPGENLVQFGESGTYLIGPDGVLPFGPFSLIVILSDLWKEMGWSAIIFLAALMGIDPVLYEAADVEGASRWQRLWNITLPGIVDVIVVVTLLKIGNILDAGFHQLFVLYSTQVYSVGDIVDTWVYRSGILDAKWSLATAVGLFKGVIGTLMLVVSNRLAKKITGNGLY